MRSATLAGAILLVSAVVVSLGTNLANAQQSNSTFTDVTGTCTVEPGSTFHYCYGIGLAREIGIGLVVGVVALSVGLGAAGLKYRTKGT